LVAVFIVGMALSACSSPSPPGVLTQQDIPGYMGVKIDSPGVKVSSPFAATAARQRKSPPDCGRGSVTAFGSPPGPQEGAVTVLVSTDWSCANRPDAQKAFGLLFRQVGGRLVSGVGDAAAITSAGGNPRSSRSFSVEWWEGNQVGAVLIQGGPKDKRITPALAELLASRAAARS
jgi:hypothetical protein